MSEVDTLINRSSVHPDWYEILKIALSSVDDKYLESLSRDSQWLPGIDQLFAAFRRDRSNLRYLLIGESPYPRQTSANGIAFYDAAVAELWSDQGLSKAVNRATSLRNIMKTAMLAQQLLQRDEDGKVTQAAIAAVSKTGLVTTMAQLFDNFERAGFLLLNATPVLHPARKPQEEARYWIEFLNQVLLLTAQRATKRPTLILWGKVANLIASLPAGDAFDHLVCEHPYNLSFIDNPEMKELFAKLQILNLTN
jgi:uracil-DNA glycosylase